MFVEYFVLPLCGEIKMNIMSSIAAPPDFSTYKWKLENRGKITLQAWKCMCKLPDWVGAKSIDL